MSTVNFKAEAFNKKNVKNLADFKNNKQQINSKTNELVEAIQEYVAKQDDYINLIYEIQTGRQEKRVLENLIEDYLSERKEAMGLSLRKTIEEIVNVMVGWERLQPLMEDPEITNIFTNDSLQVLKRVKGRDSITNIKFNSDEELEQFIKNVAIRTGEKINRDKCITDGFDKVYNVRINAAIYGSAIRKGEVVRKPYLAIRRYPAREFTPEKFIENGTFNQEIYEFYNEVVHDSNIIIVGEPDAGKTTHLDFLNSLKDPMRRTIFIEEEAELGNRGKNSVSFETRKTSGEETRIQYDMAEFTKIATRLAGKDVQIGEVRDREAWYIYRLLDMGYKAAYTVHGSSCAGGLEQTQFLMSLQNHNMSYTQLMNKICNTVDFVIFVSNRKVIDIAEVKGFNMETENPELNYIFKLQVDDNGEFFWKKGELSPEYRSRLILRKKLQERMV